MKQRKFPGMLIAIPLVLAAHCVTPMGIAPSNIPLHPDQIEKQLGPAAGASTRINFSPLCLFSMGHPDFDEAITAALESSKGDALIDIRWYKKEICMLVATWDKLHISGTAVKLKPKIDADDKRKK